MLFQEIRLHKLACDKNLYTEVAPARQIMACYSRGRICAVGGENSCGLEGYSPKIEVPPSRRARNGPTFLHSLKFKLYKNFHSYQHVSKEWQLIMSDFLHCCACTTSQAFQLAQPSQLIQTVPTCQTLPTGTNLPTFRMSNCCAPYPPCLTSQSSRLAQPSQLAQTLRLCPTANPPKLPKLADLPIFPRLRNLPAFCLTPPPPDLPNPPNLSKPLDLPYPRTLPNLALIFSHCCAP